ncbi:MAG: TetR/AcrR family transcriptional regulator, partial [Bacilli bacterium]|nr:TetR/AcrR family transcriptional regulator [Bacilli bacterium]
MNKNEIKAELTKEKLYKSYMNLYKKKDITKITIKEITDSAGYNRGTFYLYFKDVYDIHEKMKKRLIFKAKDTLKTIGKENNDISFEVLFKAIVSFYLKNENDLLPLIT